MMSHAEPKPQSPYPNGATRVFALVGNPNCGKTTLFNALTGLRQKVGNYAGVTVDCKVGECRGLHGERFRIVDLPGAYSLAAISPDEAVMQQVLLGRRDDVPSIDAVVCVLDASVLERSLYIATQVVEIGLPVIFALKMVDTARQSGIDIDAEALEKRLGVPVVRIEGEGARSVVPLKIAMSAATLKTSPWRRSERPRFLACVESVMEALAECPRCKQFPDEAHLRVCARMLITGDAPTSARGGAAAFPERAVRLARRFSDALTAEEPQWRQARVGERYAAIGELLDGVLRHRVEGLSLTERLDKAVLHPVFGWVVLAAVLAVVFYAVFSLARFPMDAIEWGVERASVWLAATLPAGAVADLTVNGILAGVGAVLIFLPQILLLFFFLALLESTGFLARATFMLDRALHVFGLHGKAFIPLLSGYACAVPGVLATRTIESRRDRLITILVLPWMSCSARLPVYLLLIAALWPDAQGGAVAKAALLLGLYALGTASALGAAWVWSRTLLRGERAPFMMELPPYHRPRWKEVGFELWDKAGAFLRTAGTIILGMAIVLWALVSYPRSPEGTDPSAALEHTYAGQLGKWIEPAIRPLGFDWKIGVGLLTSFGAREVFVSTMNIISGAEGASAARDEAQMHLKEDFGPAAASDMAGAPAETAVVRRLKLSPLTCAGLLVFYVYALQCMSTLAVVGRETRSFWIPVGMVVYMTGVAYLAAWLVRHVGLALGFS